MNAGLQGAASCRGQPATDHWSFVAFSLKAMLARNPIPARMLFRPRQYKLEEMVRPVNCSKVRDGAEMEIRSDNAVAKSHRMMPLPPKRMPVEIIRHVVDRGAVGRFLRFLTSPRITPAMRASDDASQRQRSKAVLHGSDS